MQITPEQLTSPFLRAIYDYWLRVKADRSAPERRDIDPVNMPLKVLPYLLLVEFERNPFRVRYRLAGTNVVEMNGGEFTGKYLDEMAFPPSIGDMLHAFYLRAADTGEPIFGCYDWGLRYGGLVPVEFAILPLLVDGSVTQCLGAEHSAPNLPLSKDDFVDM